VHHRDGGDPGGHPGRRAGGNADGLFPTLDPNPTTSPVQPVRNAPKPQKARTRPIADTSALPEGAPIVGAQLAGLAALALALVLAITGLRVHRRPNATKQTPDASTVTPAPAQGDETPPPATLDSSASDEDK
jgi:hypothetical protein